MLAPLLAVALAAAPDLTTTAERTGFESTGRYDEAVRLCHALERAFPGRARCFAFGTTPEGREMVALAASADGVLDPQSARARRRPVVLVQGAIHAGELDGKDAGLITVRDLLARGGGPLARVTLVLVPVLNVDGHERFGPHQRPNQRGPAEGGWRATAQNLNLNRDFAKADAPETRAALRLLGAWDPLVYADLHVTDGAMFEQDVAVLVDPRFAGDDGLRAEGTALSEALLERLGRAGHLPVDFYPSFEREDDPRSGFARSVMPPRFASAYWAARNRFGILVEAHSWRTYRERVRTAADFLSALLELAAERGSRWREAIDRADDAATRLAGTEIALAWAPGEHARTVPFRGYAYAREPSPVSGQLATRYDETRPARWDLPLREDLRPTVRTRLPRGGWIVPPAVATWMREKLALHGVAFEPLAAAHRHVDVEAFRCGEVRFRPEPYEGRQTVAVKGAWAREVRDVAAGALYVPVAQAQARLAAQLLEPEGPDSFLAWGFMNAIFERKEYLEPYVAEDFAQQLLARDPATRAEFERRLAEDPGFAKDPQARLEFFYRRHPAWDEAYRLYPVLRVEAHP